MMAAEAFALHLHDLMHRAALLPDDQLITCMSSWRHISNKPDMGMCLLRTRNTLM